MKLFWNFGKRGEVFLTPVQANELAQLIGELAKLVREDRQARLEQFKAAKKKMDEEDIEYFEEDIRKIDKIENCKYKVVNTSSCHGDRWGTYPCLQGSSQSVFCVASAAPLWHYTV